MSIPSILRKETLKKKDKNIDLQENNINDLVVSASRVIAPLWLSLHLQLITLGWGWKSNHLNKLQIG